jgi:hypothetical protein
MTLKLLSLSHGLLALKPKRLQCFLIIESHISAGMAYERRQTFIHLKYLRNADDATRNRIEAKRIVILQRIQEVIE